MHLWYRFQGKGPVFLDRVELWPSQLSSIKSSTPRKSYDTKFCKFPSNLYYYFSKKNRFHIYNLQEQFKQGLKHAVAIQSVSSKKEDRDFVIEMVDSVALVCNT